MTNNDKLKRLKLLAKRHARSTAQPLYVAQNLIATKLGCPHWNALTARAKGDWAPAEAEIAELEAMLEEVLSFAGAQFNQLLGGSGAVSNGNLQGHSCRLQTMCGDVYMIGDGWQIHLKENPLAAPQVRTYAATILR